MTEQINILQRSLKVTYRAYSAIQLTKNGVLKSI